MYSKYSNLTEEANKKYTVRKPPISPNHKFSAEDFLMLEEINVTSNDVTRELLEPLKYAKNLKRFNVTLNSANLARNIADFNFLKNATNLEQLYFLNQDENIKAKEDIDLKDLANLQKLKDVRLNSVNVKNLSALQNANLTTLVVTEGNVDTIDFVKNMTNLERLELTNNQITNIPLLENLTKLKTLYLYGNQVTDLTNVFKIKSLEALHLKNTPITTINGVENLTNLHRLRLDGTKQLTNYIPVLKNMNSLNTFAVDSITKEDFEWLKTNLIRPEVSATYGEDKERVVTFKNMEIVVTVNASDVKEGKVTIDNPLKDWDEMFVTDENSEQPNENLDFKTSDGKIIVNVGDKKEAKEEYNILLEDYNNMYGDYQRPATIEGRVTLKIKIV